MNMEEKGLEFEFKTEPKNNDSYEQSQRVADRKIGLDEHSLEFENRDREEQIRWGLYKCKALNKLMKSVAKMDLQTLRILL